MAIRGFQDCGACGERIPVNPINPEGVTRKGALSRPYVYGLLERFDLEGFEDHEAEELSSLLGIPVDPEHPTDYQIGRALQLRAEFEDYCGLDKAELIGTAYAGGRLTAEEHDQLLADLWLNQETERASAAHRILMGKTLGQRDFSPAEQECQRELRRWVAGCRDQPPPLPDPLARHAQHLLDTERQRWRGELPRARRRSKTDRRRMSTFEARSFRDQLGRLAVLTDPGEIAKAVAELRRQMKDLGLVPRAHDKRTQLAFVRGSTGSP